MGNNTKKVDLHQDFSGNQLKNFVVWLRTTAQMAAALVSEGMMAWDSTLKRFKYHNGTEIKSFLQIGDWTEDISFEFRDIDPGVSQTYILDVKASFDYTIVSVVLQSDEILNNIAININTTPVEGMEAIDILAAVVETSSTGDNLVSAGDQVTLVTSITDCNTTLLRGKLKIVRS